MEFINEALQKLVSTYKHVQCSDDKSSKFYFLKFDEAITKKFIRFGDRTFIPAISIDIDTHKDKGKILSICAKNNLPNPNLVVETTKGLHIHWVLEHPVVVTRFAQHTLYRSIAESLVELFESDKNAIPKYSGRMFRNPLLHKTVVYNENFVSLGDFQHIAKKRTYTPRSHKKQNKISFNASETTTGNRNNSLFDYGRKLAYKMGNVQGLDIYLDRELTKANSMLQEPLPISEIKGIVTSITNFMKNYKKKTSDVRTIKFNRELAKQQADKKFKEIIVKLASNPLITVKFLKGISARKGGELFGISKNTFSKYRDAIIQFILSGFNKFATTIKNITNFITRPITNILVTTDTINLTPT